MKKFVKEYFEKAVAKKIAHDKKKAEQKNKGEATVSSPTPPNETMINKGVEESDGDEGMELSDDDPGKEKEDDLTPATPTEQMTNGERLKRKRGDEDGFNGVNAEDDDATPSKRPRSATPPSPPPPPPPPAAGGNLLGVTTPSELTTPNNDVIMDRAGDGQHDNLGQASIGVSPEDLYSANKDFNMDDTNPQRPPTTFHVPLRRDSILTDLSDSAPSPSLINASDVTPMESDSERDGEQGRPFPGVNLERVQQLQVHDGV